ncbi:MAG: membrane protein insertion efficiency factor YidD [Elusimicrobia bacterium]|nr:membrane protein insertion efficiency factor YidD [Elusimicrobiota bacterium]MDE2425499.1 membrane protein insertion efficiency factor YidD [Elusimicrobiota bacterium]
MKAALLSALKAYRALARPLMRPACRFHPSCGDYAVQSVERFGALLGSWLAAKRLLRCHPFNPGGVDPIPEHRYRHG